MTTMPRGGNITVTEADDGIIVQCQGFYEMDETVNPPRKVAARPARRLFKEGEEQLAQNYIKSVRGID